MRSGLFLPVLGVALIAGWPGQAASPGSEFGGGAQGTWQSGGPDPIPPGTFTDVADFAPMSASPAGEKLASLLAQKRARVVILGEDHTQPEPRAWLAAHIKAAPAGSILALELPSDWQGDAQEGKLQDLARMLAAQANPRVVPAIPAMMRLIDAALKQGMNIRFIDVPLKENGVLMKQMTEDEFYRSRDQTIAENLIRLYDSNPDAEILAFIGAVHAHKSRVPGLLLKQGIASVSIRVTSAGDPAAGHVDAGSKDFCRAAPYGLAQYREMIDSYDYLLVSCGQINNGIYWSHHKMSLDESFARAAKTLPPVQMPSPAPCGILGPGCP